MPRSMSGDMAMQDEDGFYFLVDRKKDVIVSGGENLYPVQIEDFLRQYDKVLALPFKDSLKRPERDNIIDGYINRNEEDVCADGNWQKYFTSRPEPLTDEEIKAYLSSISGVSLGSDAFFPFADNIERARRSGVSYIAEPGGSIRDDAVIDCCNKYGIVMAFTKMRLFHH